MKSYLFIFFISGMLLLQSIYVYGMQLNIKEREISRDELINSYKKKFLLPKDASACFVVDRSKLFPSLDTVADCLHNMLSLHEKGISISEDLCRSLLLIFFVQAMDQFLMFRVYCHETSYADGLIKIFNNLAKGVRKIFPNFHFDDIFVLKDYYCVLNNDNNNATEYTTEVSLTPSMHMKMATERRCKATNSTEALVLPSFALN